MSDNTAVEIHDTELALNQMIWVQNFIITAISVPFFFMIKDAPDVPPSLVSMKEPDNKSIMPTLHKVKSNRNFLFLLVIFAFMEGTFFCFGVTVDEILSPYDFTSSEVAMVGGLSILFGVVSSTIAGIVI